MTTKAHTRYRTKGGTIVPGVTTVINLLAKPALIYWAWDLGMKGEDFRKVRDKAADIGTVAHYLVECDIKGEKPDLGDTTPNVLRSARRAFNAYLDWRKNFILKNIECEAELVSEKYLFGGKLDWVARDPDGLVWLIDVKTGKGIYTEYRYQLAAYVQLWDENHPDTPIDRVAIIKLDKVSGDFSFHPFGDLAVELEIFLSLRNVYALQKNMDKNRDNGRVYKRVAANYTRQEER